MQVNSTNNWLLASGDTANNGNGVSLSVNTTAAACTRHRELYRAPSY